MSPEIYCGRTFQLENPATIEDGEPQLPPSSHLYSSAFQAGSGHWRKTNIFGTPEACEESSRGWSVF